MYCTAPLSPRKGRLRSFHDDDDDDESDSIIQGTAIWPATCVVTTQGLKWAVWHTAWPKF